MPTCIQCLIFWNIFLEETDERIYQMYYVSKVTPLHQFIGLIKILIPRIVPSSIRCPLQSKFNFPIVPMQSILLLSFSSEKSSSKWKSLQVKPSCVKVQCMLDGWADWQTGCRAGSQDELHVQLLHGIENDRQFACRNGWSLSYIYLVPLYQTGVFSIFFWKTAGFFIKDIGHKVISTTILPRS